MTPKLDFLQTQAAKSHFDLTATEPFKQAMNACLLQLVADVTAGEPADPDASAARYHKIAGAVQFHKTLMNLGTKPEPGKTKSIGNLDHQIK